MGLGLGVRVRAIGWDIKWFYDQDSISITKEIIRWNQEDLNVIWKEFSQIPQRLGVSTPKPDVVQTIDLSEFEGEENRFIDFGNEICSY
jgi:hypothetical protein